MNNPDFIDIFLATFSRYIDNGFGLLGGEVSYLSTVLITIDVTLAGLFWAWGADEDVLRRLVKKTLYVGAFAFLVGNFQNLSTIVFNSFAGLGLKAAGSSMSVADFLRPGWIGSTGIDVALQLLNNTTSLLGPISTLTNLPQVLILLAGAALIMLAFFIMAIQVFVTVIEFKLVTLAGFVLLPFAFFNRTAFMAERVLGHIMSSGVKLLVLAVVTGIGTTLFHQLLLDSGLTTEIGLRTAMALVLAALALLGLAIFGPGVANGIVAGGPQLDAGSAMGTALIGGGTLGAGLAGAQLAAGAAAGTVGGAAMGGARIAGATSGAWQSGTAGRSDPRSLAGGAVSVGRAAAGAAASPLRRAVERIKQSYDAGRAGTGASSLANPSATSSAGRSEPPAWAKAHAERLKSAGHTAAHTLRHSDAHGGGASVDLGDKD